METNNFNINVQFDEAKKCASEMNVEVLKMKNILNDLEACVSSMTWSGANASHFKDSVKKAKEDLDIIYNEYIVKIPSAIEDSVAKYKKYEE